MRIVVTLFCVDLPILIDEGFDQMTEEMK